MKQGREKVSVVFVCTGNICRSPTAEGIFIHKVAAAGLAGVIDIDSAGTHGYHIGEAPDPRTVRHAAGRCYDLSNLRARRFDRTDFERFDLVVAMDAANREHLARMMRPSSGHKLKMMMDYAKRFNMTEVPDPYYGGPDGFEHVIDLLEDATEGLLAELRATLGG
jgi:protein-tyrosine phosphatase